MERNFGVAALGERLWQIVWLASEFQLLVLVLVQRPKALFSIDSIEVCKG